MKLKYYLRGAGIGIIIATVILMSAFQIHENQAADRTAEPATEQEERSIAEALAEAETEPPTDTEQETEPPADSEQESETPAQTERASEAAPETESVSADAQTADETGDGSGQDASLTAETAAQEKPDADEADPKVDETAPGEAAEEPTVPSGKIFTVSIYHGDSPGMVAKRLAAEGVIEDADVFYEYLVTNGLNDSLEVGTFTISQGAKIDEIARILTTNEYEARQMR